jgi:hypothetical protein
VHHYVKQIAWRFPELQRLSRSEPSVGDRFVTLDLSTDIRHELSIILMYLDCVLLFVLLTLTSLWIRYVRNALPSETDRPLANRWTHNPPARRRRGKHAIGSFTLSRSRVGVCTSRSSD